MQDIQHSESVKICPTFCDGKKLTVFQQSLLWSKFMRAPDHPTGQVLTQFAEEGKPLSISVRHVNRLRGGWGLQRGKGRPRGQTMKVGQDVPVKVSDGTEQSEGVRMTPSLSYVGGHLFAAWVDDQGAMCTGRDVDNTVYSACCEQGADARMVQ